MGATIYDIGLDRNPANYQPLTPLTFLERAADVFPDRVAVIHGLSRQTYRELRARSHKLASALAKRGIVRGDTVAVVLANTPAMVEAHYGIPMCGAVLNAINTRLDPVTIAFILDHGEAKVLIVDGEFSKTVREALAIAKRRPLVVDFADPVAAGDEEVVDVLAVGLHPRVRSGANGTHYTSEGALPMVPGFDAVARRAERAIVALAAVENISPETVKFANRLSDLLFVAARYANDQGRADILWKPGANR